MKIGPKPSMYMFADGRYLTENVMIYSDNRDVIGSM